MIQKQAIAVKSTETNLTTAETFAPKVGCHAGFGNPPSPELRPNIFSLDGLCGILHSTHVVANAMPCGGSSLQEASIAWIKLYSHVEVLPVEMPIQKQKWQSLNPFCFRINQPSSNCYLKKHHCCYVFQ